MPDLTKRKSLDLEILLSLIHPHEADVVNALIPFCKHLAHSKHLRNPEWLFAVPLIHFLLRQSTPFEIPEKKNDKIVWEDSQLNMAKLREKTSVKTNIGYVSLLLHNKCVIKVIAKFPDSKQL